MANNLGKMFASFCLGELRYTMAICIAQICSIFRIAAKARVSAQTRLAAAKRMQPRWMDTKAANARSLMGCTHSHTPSTTRPCCDDSSPHTHTFPWSTKSANHLSDDARATHVTRVAFTPSGSWPSARAGTASTALIVIAGSNAYITPTQPIVGI